MESGDDRREGENYSTESSGTKEVMSKKGHVLSREFQDDRPGDSPWFSILGRSATQCGAAKAVLQVLHTVHVQ